MPEQLVRIQVDAPVITVAIVEMTVANQDFRPLEIVERFPTKILAFVHDPSLG
jgi:hypothetical protein